MTESAAPAAGVAPGVPGAQRGLVPRVRAGLRARDNWRQLVRFAVVGGSGFAVNLAVFWVLVHAAGVDFRLANIGAYLIAVTSNFTWDRRWTFRRDARGGHAGFQAARFFLVSLGAQAVVLVLLEVLVTGLGMAKLPAQALAIVAATPLNFVGNKLWSFGR